MNKVILMGRLTRDPEVRYSQGGENSLAIARYTLAVDRRFKRNGDDQTADFIIISHAVPSLVICRVFNFFYFLFHYTVQTFLK